eukprot:TRINITY_DN19188_c0_g1_i1.p1 TRINITY_DN19188_c0_g1~~TRINITY_DN19188_c0_g1_i1.p1  ORF type:complete len:239 (+),score=29.19 TRINITY_DN19188_c0_g1_i1:64-717(+)
MVRSLCVSLLLLRLCTAEPSVPCPDSPAKTHAWAAVTIKAKASCDNVRNEMRARVAGQETGTWSDPHDGGNGKQKYTMLDDAANLTMTRLSSNGVYTDKLLFTFTSDGSDCRVTGCSRSQGMSMGDQSTNYCNLRNLYCGSKERCCHLKSDFEWTEEKFEKSVAASKNAGVCLGGQGGSGSGFGGEEQTSCPKPNETNFSFRRYGGVMLSWLLLFWI